MNEQYIERYWRDATPADAIREPPMVARFRDDEKYEWRINLLRGIRQGAEFPWFSETKGSFEHCQVYDAPDPGEGWRLIDVDKDKPQFSDEYYLPGSKTWTPRDHVMAFSTEQSYRRRIEQPKPKYEPFRWEDREQLRGRWIAYDDGNFEVYPTSFFLAESTFFVGTLDAQKLVDHWRFLDTGEPVGRRVE